MWSPSPTHFQASGASSEDLAHARETKTHSDSGRRSCCDLQISFAVSGKLPRRPSIIRALRVAQEIDVSPNLLIRADVPEPLLLGRVRVVPAVGRAWRRARPRNCRSRHVANRGSGGDSAARPPPRMQRPVSRADNDGPVDAADGPMNGRNGPMNRGDRPMNGVVHRPVVPNDRSRGVCVGRNEGHGAGHGGEGSDQRFHCRLPSDIKLRRA